MQSPTPPYDHLLVIGSINADIYLELSNYPKCGETITAKKTYMLPGGKGANQAVALARLSKEEEHTVCFVANFGNDNYGRLLNQTMLDNNVSLEFSNHVEESSGQAYILLQDDGNNTIIIIPGSNNSWPQELPLSLCMGIQSAKLILLQREIPDYVNLQVLQVAKKSNVPVIFDCGGKADPIPNSIISLATIISPNETELERILGKSNNSEEEMIDAVREFQKKNNAGDFLIKLGEKGAMYISFDGKVLKQTAMHVDKVIDTTGAGDCFTAAFCRAMADGRSKEDSLLFAVKAATICITRKGAIPSMPYLNEIVSN